VAGRRVTLRKSAVITSAIASFELKNRKVASLKTYLGTYKDKQKMDFIIEPSNAKK
jgi:hypothetical protein